MSRKTPFFEAFGPLLFGRPGRKAAKKAGRIDALQELYEIFGHLLPARLLEPSEEGSNSRERVFSARVTFWAFAAQVLSPGTACREIVRRVQAWYEEFSNGDKPVSASTSAYCQARARLEMPTLDLIRGEVAWSLERHEYVEFLLKTPRHGRPLSGIEKELYIEKLLYRLRRYLRFSEQETQNVQSQMSYYEELLRK